MQERDDQAAIETFDVAGPMGRGGGRRRSQYATRDLTTGSIPRNLAFLAWPQIIEGTLNTFDQIADLFWAGRGIGSKAIASIAVAQNYIMFIRLGRQGVDMSARAMIARAVGSGDVRLANHVAVQAFNVNIVLALITIIPGVIFTEFLLRILGVSDAIIATGATYMKIQFLASAAHGLRMMAGAMLQASGDTLTPMKATVAARAIDWILTPFIMFGWLGLPALGLPGVAVVNTLSGVASFGINTYALFAGTSRLHLHLRDYRVDPRVMWNMVWIGGPASINAAERSLAQLVLVGIVASFGDIALAAWGLTRRVESIANLGSQGVGNASGIIAAQSLGAGKPERARATVYWSLGYVVILKGVLIAIIYSFPVFFLSIFNQEPEMLEAGTRWLRILIVGFMFMGISGVFMQTYQICGDTLMPMLTTLATVYLVEIPLAFALTGVTAGWSIFGWSIPTVAHLAEYGVGWAAVIALAARLPVYIPYFFWGPWMRKGVLAGLAPMRGRAAGAD